MKGNFSQSQKQSLLQGNLLPLAFLGDSIHTLFVRDFVIKNLKPAGSYAGKATSFCKASAQASALKQIIPLLNDDEKDIVRRARNAKPKHTSKNASSADYCFATAFEALVGYLYLQGDEARLNQILTMSIKRGEDSAD